MAAALIGPNAVIQMGAALTALAGRGACALAFERAGLHRYLEAPPRHMIDENEALALHGAVRGSMDREHAERIAREAGRLTGLYIVENRIPRAAQRVLKFLPRRLALRVLFMAMAKHAWTFAGSGTFSWVVRPSPALFIRHSLLARGMGPADAPACTYYQAAFEEIITRATGRLVRVTETECEAAGAPACRFDVRFGS